MNTTLSFPTPVATHASHALQLHLVPAGRRLDFDIPAGHFAYVYRRLPRQAWQCIAHNACSPLLDRHPLPAGVAPEYQVRFRNAAGELVSSSAVVQAAPAGRPASPAWTSMY